MPCKRKYESKAVHLHLRLEVHAAILALAEATDQRPSRLITDLLEHSLPQFQILLRAALMAKTTPQAAAGALQEMMDSAMEQAGKAQEDIRQLDMLAA